MRMAPFVRRSVQIHGKMCMELALHLRWMSTGRASACHQSTAAFYWFHCRPRTPRSSVRRCVLLPTVRCSHRATRLPTLGIYVVPSSPCFLLLILG
ncbi:hypothetical protein L227DRAFT_275046 [Lentinus tigrinus ALCF2SS1-6]|uniref:Uncharacterized protein n=1 Tax=Lentinus tigrinus ALCF2SS1-6 TaxID=1328759 RepID=A0A5C2SPH5_9APHY|nr:hypothetical protein L227DRAFT_275046 [Lentinus tigrinus ALCF2SS1-6]